MATQGFKVNFSTYTDPVILVWYLHTNPVAEVGRVSLPFPNIDGEVVEASNLIGATYVFRFFTTLDGTTLDQLIESWSVDVAKGTKTRLQRYFYTVNGAGAHDPAAEQNELHDDRLVGADNVYAWQRGVGFLLPSEYTILTGGGFSLNGGAVFSESDVWMSEALYRDDIDNVVITGDFSEIKIVTEDETVDSTYTGRQVIADFAVDGTGVISFPDFSLIANGRMKFSTYQNSGRYLRLQFSAGNTVKHLGEDVNHITLRKREHVELLFKDGDGYVMDYRGDAELAGEYVFADKQLLNTELADGSVAQIADYQDLIDRLPAEKICSYDAYDQFVDLTIGSGTKRKYPNRSKFAVDTISGEFKFPDIRGQSLRALNYVDGTDDTTMLSQGAGGRWAEEMIAHRHDADTTGAFPGPDPAQSLVRSKVVGDGNQHIDYLFLTGGDEQRVDSTGLYGLVRI